MADPPLNAPDRPNPGRPDDTRTRVLLAMLHGARDRGDRAEAARLWLLILVAELERVRGLVGAFRHESLPGGRIPAADVDDVVHEVFLRLHDKAGSLKGRSPGELRSFMRTATGFACRDYVGRHVRDDQHRHGSLDAASADGAPTSTDRELAALVERLAADDDEALIAREIVHPALALVDPDKRMVLVMDQSGYSTPEIVERLGISRDTVYQRRRRGNQQLHAAIRELAGEDEG
ncbi:MAG: sigma-70 family RNA polymerase sigma factor [Solirubrobacteraceae bacterium]|nr:sigma-70 family RNA polymerase sigma factor [Solirubrobacteraceae bacterium]